VLGFRTVSNEGMMPGVTTRFRIDDTPTEADADELWPVYDLVFGDVDDRETWRRSVWDKHICRDGFRLARAYDEKRGLVGFAYGYTGQPGQWWTDSVRQTLEPAVAEDWLGGHFELVSIGVAPAVRRGGTGRRLLRALVDDLPHDRLLLMTTSDETDPARALYASEGWEVLGPGVGDGTVVMGKRSPDRHQRHAHQGDGDTDVLDAQQPLA
jgi:ribosomal protein S18 acetylase RimI-like enzyme